MEGLPKEMLHMLRFWCLQVCCGFSNCSVSNTNEISLKAAESCLRAAPVQGWIQGSSETNQVHRLAFLNKFSFSFLSPGSSGSQIAFCDTGNLLRLQQRNSGLQLNVTRRTNPLTWGVGKNFKEKQLLLCLLQGVTLHREVKKLGVQGRVTERITWIETWFEMKEQWNVMNFIHQKKVKQRLIYLQRKKYKYWWQQEVTKESRVGRWGWLIQTRYKAHFYHEDN